MGTDTNSERQNKNILKEIATELEREGFQTSWRDPFFPWVHGIPLNQRVREDEIGNILYILEPPVPKIAPFDFAAVSLRIDFVRLSFALTLYYTKVLENIVDAETINEIYDRHATRWTPGLHAFFNDITREFSLTWDTEYDEHIEESLCGVFPVDSSHRIIDLMNALKRRLTWWKQKGR